jgi:hypothetical protein
MPIQHQGPRVPRNETYVLPLAHDVLIIGTVMIMHRMASRRGQNALTALNKRLGHLHGESLEVQ